MPLIAEELNRNNINNPNNHPLKNEKDQMMEGFVNTLKSIDRPGDFASGGSLPADFALPGLKLFLQNNASCSSSSNTVTNETQDQKESINHSNNQNNNDNSKNFNSENDSSNEEFIALPLIPPQARRIIAQVASKAPFGRGEDTIYDDSVRKSYQLEPLQFRITNPNWNQLMRQVLDSRIKKDLGIREQIDIQASLYKMLLYEPGGHFNPHRDTEKEERMFGSLIIQLPCEYTSDGLEVSHNNHHKKFNFSRGAPYQPYFAAFYADCVHQVHPLKSGYRLCLVYNLLYKPNRLLSEPPRPVTHQEQINQLRIIIHQWINSMERNSNQELIQQQQQQQTERHQQQKNIKFPFKLFYILGHQYTTFNLSFKHLKNKDAAIAQVLKQINTDSESERSIWDSEGVELRLCMLTKKESGPAELFGPWDDDAEMIDAETEYEIDHWVDVNDERDTLPRIQNYISSFDESSSSSSSSLLSDFMPSNLSVDESEIVPEDAVEQMTFQGQDVQENTGNEGATMDRWYRNATIMVWPKSLTFDMILEADRNAAIKFAAQSTKQYQLMRDFLNHNSNNSNDNNNSDNNNSDNNNSNISQDEKLISSDELKRYEKQCRKMLISCMKSINSKPTRSTFGIPYIFQNNSNDIIAILLEALYYFGDLNFILQFIQNQVMSSPSSVKDHGRLLFKLCLVPEWRKQIGPIIGNVFEAMSKKPQFSENVASLLSEISKCTPSSSTTTNEQQNDQSLLIALTLVDRLFYHYDIHLQNSPQQQQKELAGLPLDPFEIRRIGMGPIDQRRHESMASIVLSLMRFDRNQHVKQIIQRLKLDPETFDAHQFLTPLLRSLAREVDLKNPDHVLWELLDFTIDSLSHQTASFVPTPVDWSVSAQLRCHCNYCTQVNQFLRDPSRQVHRIPVRKDIRKHIHRNIDAVTSEVDHTTTRSGSPYTLVLTKNQNGYKSKIQLRNNKIESLKRLKVIRGDHTPSSSSSSSSAFNDNNDDDNNNEDNNNNNGDDSNQPPRKRRKTDNSNNADADVIVID